MTKKVCFLVAFVLLRCATSQACALPDATAINNGLMSLLVSVGVKGGTLSTTILDHHFTCLAVSSSRDQYRQVSVAVRYTKSTESGQFTTQFPLSCTSGTTMETIGMLDQSPPANVFNISTRKDCFICTQITMQPGFTIDTTADCARELPNLYAICPPQWHDVIFISSTIILLNIIVCDSSCLMMGQGGCVTFNDCCPFYNTDGSCTTICPINFAATPSTNYTCSEYKLACMHAHLYLVK